jgi:hypothetical protein
MERTTSSCGSSRCGFVGATRIAQSIGWKEKEANGYGNDDWEDLDARALNTIWLCLVDDVLFNIVGEETTTGLWSRMESLYMMKSLTNQIYLKRKLYSL